MLRTSWAGRVGVWGGMDWVVISWLFLELFEIFGGDFDIFEVVGAVGAEDGFLVTFAEEKDEVAGFGEI